MIHFLPRALALGGLLVLVGAVLPGHPSLLAQAFDPGEMSRPDSVRALVLDKKKDTKLQFSALVDWLPSENKEH